VSEIAESGVGDIIPMESSRVVILDPEQNNLSLWNIWEQFEKLMGFLPSPNVKILSTSSSDLSDSSFIVLPYNQKDHSDNKDDEQIIQKLKSEIELLNEENAALNSKYQILLKKQNVPTAVKDLLQENAMLKKSITTFRYQVQKHTESMRTSIILSPGTPMSPTRSPQTPQFKKTTLSPPTPEEITIAQLKILLRTKDQEIEDLKKYKIKYNKIIDKAKKKKEGSVYLDSTTSSGSSRI